MATPPTFVAEYELTLGWDSATQGKTATVTTAVDDLLVFLGGNEDYALTGPVPSGTLTWGAALEDQAALSRGRSLIYVADGIASALWVLTGTVGGSGVGVNKYGFTALRFADTDGAGAHAGAVGASVAGTQVITTTADNSAVAIIIVDWSAADGASRTWATVNSITPTAANGYERVYFRNQSDYVIYVAYYPDVGVAGAKTVGISGSLGGHSKAAVEILATTTPPPPPPDPSPGVRALPDRLPYQLGQQPPPSVGFDPRLSSMFLI